MCARNLSPGAGGKPGCGTSWMNAWTSTPSWPARIAQTYPPGPLPITNNLQAMSFMASAFDEDQRGRFEQRLDALHEARRIEAIYHTMIKARGQVHHIAGDEG